MEKSAGGRTTGRALRGMVSLRNSLTLYATASSSQTIRLISVLYTSRMVRVTRSDSWYSSAGAVVCLLRSVTAFHSR